MKSITVSSVWFFFFLFFNVATRKLKSAHEAAIVFCWAPLFRPVSNPLGSRSECFHIFVFGSVECLPLCSSFTVIRTCDLIS